MKKLLITAYFLVLTVYALFSYSLTDPNLVLTTWSPYWHFQQWLWQTFFVNAKLLSETYATLVALMFGCYFLIISKLPTKTGAVISFTKSSWKWVVLLVLPLLFSYNALSHDVFNYIFNAKIVLIYHANPQNVIAINYLPDPLLRFMHNTDTPAPYGIAWIGISLLPFLLGFGKFTLTWFLFRCLSLLSVAALIFAYVKLAATDFHKQKIMWPAFLMVLLNPLFLIEVISNSHNDVWMMAPALLSLALLLDNHKLRAAKVLFSICLLAFSISIKLSTLVLIPIWLAVFVEQFLGNFQLPSMLRKLSSFIHAHYADLSVLLLFLPLLTPRSQQFNAWYLVWLLVWLPFLRWRWLKGAILVLSVSSLYRYLPWLLAGGFSDKIVLDQKLITFIPLVVYLVMIGTKQLLTRNLRQTSVE